MTFDASSSAQASQEDWVLGKKEARVEIVEYSDFQCPACQAYAPVVKDVLAAFPDDVKLVYRHFPLRGIHKNSFSAALAAESAGMQGKFWEMHDTLFEKQSVWSGKASVMDEFVKYAEQLSMDAEKFRDDAQSATVKQKVESHITLGNAAQVNATPTFFLNGTKISNPASLNAFKDAVNAVLLTLPASEKQEVISSDTAQSSSTSDDYHIHADFGLFIDGKKMDFSAAKYQSTDETKLHATLHFHGANGSMVHVHEKGKKLSEFLASLGWKLDGQCLTDEKGSQMCSDAKKSLKLFINGQPKADMADYEISDLDRILLSYGNESIIDLQDQLDTVKDEACIYSRKCPARGTPPKEECVGGLGTVCE